MFFVNIGDSEVSSIVINESEAEGEEARQFLEDVRVTFPQVCVLNTVQSMLRVHQLYYTLLINPLTRLYVWM